MSPRYIWRGGNNNQNNMLIASGTCSACTVLCSSHMTEKFTPHGCYLCGGLPQWLNCKETACNEGDAGDRFNPWIRMIPWRRKWQPIPVLLTEKSHGQRSLMDYSPWGHKESDTMEGLNTQHTHFHGPLNFKWLCLNFQAIIWSSWYHLQKHLLPTDLHWVFIMSQVRV